MKDHSLIKKSLKSSKALHKPIYIYAYDEYGDNKKSRKEIYGETVELLLHKIKSDNPTADWSKQKILLLGRFGFDGKDLKESGRFEYVNEHSNRELRATNPNLIDLRLDFLTIHKAKGTTYDHVIILNTKDDVYGFPSQVMNEPIMNLVVNGEPEEIKREERRLFYVALTRTKNRVYIMTPKKNPSEFVVEIMNPCSIESNVADLQKKEKQIHLCPWCNAPLQYRETNIPTYKKDKTCHSLSVWECTKDPEVCGFMTNELAGGKLCIEKCWKCDGYLIVKKSRKDGKYLLGCTNFYEHGCDSIVSSEEELNDYLKEYMW